MVFVEAVADAHGDPAALTLAGQAWGLSPPFPLMSINIAPQPANDAVDAGPVREACVAPTTTWSEALAPRTTL